MLARHFSPLLRVGAWLPALAAVSFARADLVDALVGEREIDVIMFTEMTPAGRRLQAPRPQAPVYYVAATSGFKDLGGILAGNEELTDNEAIRNLSKALAGQGYLPATRTSAAPRLLLVFTWGTLYADFDPVTGEQKNRREMLNFVGARDMDFLTTASRPGHRSSVLSIGLTLAEAEKFEELASDELYVAAVSAYDLGAALEKRRELLWITRVSCPSRGFSLQGVMPTMMAIAAPHIGRETKPPVWVNASNRYKPQVRIEDLQLLEYLENGSLPVLEVPKRKTIREKERERRN